ncbi:MAG: MFS transporter [bacterium]
MPTHADIAQSQEQEGWHSLFKRQNAVNCLILCLTVMIPAADGMMTTTMAPSIVLELGGVVYLAWIVALYQLGGIFASAISSVLAIRFGLRGPMMVGALIFAIGCLISFAAPTMPIMLVGRLLQGFAGGTLVAFSYIATARLFSTQLMPRVIAITSGVWGMAAFTGPLIGGLLVSHAGWRNGFALFAGLAVILMIFILALKPGGSKETKVPTTNKLPTFALGRRLLLLAGAIILLMMAGTGDNYLIGLGQFAIGLLLLLLFLIADQKAGNGRMFARDILQLTRPVGAGALMVFAIMAASIAMNTHGAFFLQALYGMNALLAGYIIAATAVGWSLAAVLISHISEQHDKKMIRIGITMIVIAIIGQSWAILHGPIWLIAIFTFQLGAGFGSCWSFVMRRMRLLVSDSEIDRASASVVTLQRLGYASGAALTGLIGKYSGLSSLSLTGAGYEQAVLAIFVAMIPLALIALWAAQGFVRD